MASLTIAYGEYLVLSRSGSSKFIPWHRLHAIDFRPEEGIAKVYADGIIEKFLASEEGYTTIENYHKNLGNSCKRLIN